MTSICFLFSAPIFFVLSLDRAKKELDDHVMVTEEWEEFCSGLDRKMLIMAPFCGEIPCEDLIKKDSARQVCGTNVGEIR